MNHLLRLTASLSLSLAALLLSACATTGGVQFDPNVTQTFVVGTTTQAEVQAKLGDPQMKASNDDGTPGSTWTYAYGTSNSDNRKFIPVVGAFVAKTHAHEQTLTLEFNAKGVLTHKNTSEENF